MWQSLSRWKENHRCLVDVSSLRVVWLCTVGPWDRFVFFCVVNPRKVGRWTCILRYFFEFGPTWFSCLRKHTENCDESRVKNMSVDFPTNISIAETEELTVDSFQLSAAVAIIIGQRFFFTEDPWWRFLDLAILAIDAAPWTMNQVGWIKVSWILRVDLSTFEVNEIFLKSIRF